MTTLITIFFVIAIFIYGWKRQQLRTFVVFSVRRYCRQQNIVLLDETVALKKQHFNIKEWLNSGAVKTWQFEFTVTGAERYPAQAQTRGNQILSIQLPPHRMPEEELL